MKKVQDTPSAIFAIGIVVNLMVSAIPTSKGDICQLFQLDQLLHEDEEGLVKNLR